ncbi:hypothetical protein B1C78_12210 [Thioalkalivibrio denitrificans]|uniref:Uncharacterized protein n=1 Tax=Thioalkalivibrio denitrificans TaxID=108003 RepID=A0A1V3NDM6_9GAMM|nr:hypothetical protein [Thioalkalivibrio denitrificans]OOG23151.1 hypothetical protein B1C78_12210 [Thioalkalivibrio denitrificans]
MSLARSMALSGMAILTSGWLAGCALTDESRDGLESCPEGASVQAAYPAVTHCVPGARHMHHLGELMAEVAALSQQGEQALRDALAAPGNEPLRNALLHLALDDSDHEKQALESLEAHLSRDMTPDGEKLLASLLRDQILARQALRSSLTGARTERDALQRQLDELKAIEQQIRDRSRAPETELNSPP